MPPAHPSCLGIKGLIRDLTGEDVSVVLGTDSSAAKGIATRRGVGKVKHLETRTLWVQEHVARGTVRMKKIPGTENPADLLTKFLSAPKLEHLVKSLPIEMESGRSALAPRLQGEVSVSRGP